MATLVGKQHDPIKLLRDLVELDLDAIEAYEAAIERLDDPLFTAQLRSFREDHRRHVADLNPVIQDLGGEPVLEGDFKRILTKGKVILGGLVGDKQILAAMKSNEDDTNVAYERALENVESVSGSVVSILTRNLGDERRHRAYLEQALASLDKRAARTSRPETRASAPSFF